MNKAETAFTVQKVQEYIEANLAEPITLKQLSNVAGYSPWYTARIFKEETGKTPFDYIRSLRLTKAALILRDENKKVIDVALDFVFDSHEGFTRAFSKEFGITPYIYSKKAPPIKLFLPEKVFDIYRQFSNMKEKVHRMSNQTKTVFVQVIERPQRKVLLKRGIKATDYFQYCDEVGCDVWSVLCSVKEALYEPIGMWLPKHLIRENTSEYVQGVELPLTYGNVIPDGFEIITLPPCTMMIFQGEPYNDDDFMEKIGLVWDHIKKFNPEIYGYKWAAEESPRFQLAPMGYRGYIEGRPVRKIPDTK